MPRPSAVFFVKAELQRPERPTTTKKTKALKASDGSCQWAETFHFLLPPLDHASTLAVKLYSRSSVRRKQYLGEVSVAVGNRLSTTTSTGKKKIYGTIIYRFYFSSIIFKFFLYLFFYIQYLFCT